jgi:hypothetical protein
MKNLLVSVIFTMFNIISFAQGSGGGLSNLQGTQSSTLSQGMDAVNSRGSWLPNVNNYKVDGTPLAYELGNNKLVLVTKEGNKYKIPQGNYNAQLDKFVSVVSQDSIFVIDDRFIDFALFNNVKMKRFEDSKGKLRVYEVLASDKDVFILKKYVAKIKAGAINKMTQEKVSNDRYYIVDDLYIKNGDDFSELKLKSKLISTLFSEKQTEIKDYIKENNLSIKDEDDFVKIFNYHASLK